MRYVLFQRSHLLLLRFSAPWFISHIISFCTCPRLCFYTGQTLVYGAPLKLPPRSDHRANSKPREQEDGRKRRYRETERQAENDKLIVSLSVYMYVCMYVCQRSSSLSHALGCLPKISYKLERRECFGVYTRPQTWSLYPLYSSVQRMIL